MPGKSAASVAGGGGKGSGSSASSGTGGPSHSHGRGGSSARRLKPPLAGKRITKTGAGAGRLRGGKKH
jgi:hypothetical protein